MMRYPLRICPTRKNVWDLESSAEEVTRLKEALRESERARRSWSWTAFQAWSRS